MAEKTRVNNYHHLEFDYLAVLKAWPGCGDLLFEHCSDGQMDVKYRVTRQCVSNAYADLDPDLKLTFSSILDKCIDLECERNLCSQRLSKCSMTSMYKGCQFCSVYMKTGALKYIKTLSSDKFTLEWTRKCTSVEYTFATKKEDLSRAQTDEHTISQENENLEKYSSFFPKLCNRSTHNSFTYSVEVDFHPAIELDVTKVHWNQRMIPLKIKAYVAYLVLPNNYNFAQRIILKYLINLLKKRKLLYFVSNLLLYSGGLVLKKAAALHRIEKYLLFPKRLHYAHSCWRISTCQTELDIIHDTSEEHRLAYCVLKYLIAELSARNFISSLHVLPRIWPYEAKIAVIRHIKSCKTPRIGTHVCLLNIMHDIALCRDAGVMDHPILHLNLYETLPPKQSDEYDKAIEVISFKALLLIIAYQRKEYTLTDFINDVISLNFIWEMKGFELVRDHNRPTKKKDTREAMCEIKKLVQNRKKLSARNVLLKMILSQLRENRLQNVQENVIRNNLKDRAVVDELYESGRSKIPVYGWIY